MKILTRKFDGQSSAVCTTKTLKPGGFRWWTWCRCSHSRPT